MIRFSTLAVVAALTTGVGSQAMAAISHSYNFDNNTNDSVGSAHLTNTGGTFVPGVSGQAFSFANADAGNNPPATQYAANLAFDFNPVDTANWGFSTRIRLDSLPGGTGLDAQVGLISIGDLNGHSNSLWLFLSEGKFGIVQQNVVSGVRVGTTTVQPGTWYDVNVQLVEGNAQLWVNGVMEGSFNVTGGGIDPAPGIMIGAQWFNNLANLGDALRGATGAVDNFVIYNGVIPEPASLALLGLGGALMLRRRRN